jgi:hypothetical protein
MTPEATTEPTQEATPEATQPAAPAATFSLKLTGAVEQTLQAGEASTIMGKDGYQITFASPDGKTRIAVTFTGELKAGQTYEYGMAHAMEATPEATAEGTPEAMMPKPMVANVMVMADGKTYAQAKSATLKIDSIGADGAISGSIAFEVAADASAQQTEATPEASAENTPEAMPTSVKGEGTFKDVPVSKS